MKLEKLSNKLSGLSFMLGEDGKFSPDVDKWFDDYEYSGYEDIEIEDPKYAKKLIDKANEILENHKKGELIIRDVRPMTTFSKDVLNIDRKKKLSKTKSKRPFSKQSGEKLQAFYGVSGNMGSRAGKMISSVYRKKKSDKSKPGRKVVKKTKGCGCK